MNKYSWFFLILFIAGCSSTPDIQTQLFLLTPETHNTTTASKRQVDQNAVKTIVIDPIKLADYLDQLGIVMQTDKHQIQVAHYNRWAEPLDENIYRFILETLSADSAGYSFQKESKFTRQVSHMVLSLELNQFNGTSSGSAVMSGHWVLKNSMSNKLIMSDSFNYEEPISESGYPALVSQLALILEKACADIISSISAQS